eukprot:COSAG03_NODE_19819_length_329_cov_0.904348_1_plen_78_part_10
MPLDGQVHTSLTGVAGEMRVIFVTKEALAGALRTSSLPVISPYNKADQSLWQARASPCHSRAGRAIPRSRLPPPITQC